MCPIALVHERQLAEHGGAEGIRDEGLLLGALGRPLNRHAYVHANNIELAATYITGIVQNHPFVDENKRTGFVVGVLFLQLNGYTFTASERLGHRQSIVFDFFGDQDLDALTSGEGIEFLRGASVIQRDRNTFSAIVEREGPVKVSFFGVAALGRLQEPDVCAGNGLRVASLLDLAGTKASVVQVRAEAKDYLDVDALISSGVDLSHALAAAKALYGDGFNPQITLKALSYFGDGNLAQLLQEVKNRLAAAAQNVDLDHLPQIAAMVRESRTPGRKRSLLPRRSKRSRVGCCGLSRRCKRCPIRAVHGVCDDVRDARGHARVARTRIGR